MNDYDLDACDVIALDLIAAHRWGNLTAGIPADVIAGLVTAGYITTDNGWAKLTPAGWALYDVQGIGA